MARHPVHPPVLVGLLMVLVPAPPVAAATWQAVNTVAGSGLAARTETFDAGTVDIDRDGDEDVWIGYHDQGGRLWRNDGAGHYTRMAATAWPKYDPGRGRVVDRHQCTWADIELDGRPDAYCAAGRSDANSVKTGKDNELWLQRGPGTFTDVGTDWGIGDLCGRSQFPAFLDADGDAHPDLYVGNTAPREVAGDPCDDPAGGLGDEFSKLFLNTDGTGFRYAPEFGLGGNGGSFCAEVADYDRDGWDDLLTCGERGLERAVAVGDADGDGDLDVYGLRSDVDAGTNPRDFVYRNAGLRFTAVPVPAAGGVGDAVTTLRGYRDGRVEFLLLNGNEVPGPVQRTELVFR